MKNTKKQNNITQSIEVLKSSGVKISRQELFNQGKRHYEENESALIEAQREGKVLRMKKYYRHKGWSFPPTHHHIVSTAHLLNVYYGKEVCKHTPKDDLEKKLEV